MALVLSTAPLVLLLGFVPLPNASSATGFFFSPSVGSDGSSAIGDGSGGGMSVPSVNGENLKSSAGSSKRLAAAFFTVAVVADPFVLAGIAAMMGIELFCSGATRGSGMPECDLRFVEARAAMRNRRRGNEARTTANRRVCVRQGSQADFGARSGSRGRDRRDCAADAMVDRNRRRVAESRKQALTCAEGS